MHKVNVSICIHSHLMGIVDTQTSTPYTSRDYMIVLALQNRHCSHMGERENLSFSVFANNKVVDQPAHPRRLISAFVICFNWKVII